MSLMQLLAVGRSLRNVKDHPSRYKMIQANLLPKFSGTKEAEKRVGDQAPTATPVREKSTNAVREAVQEFKKKENSMNAIVEEPKAEAPLASVCAKTPSPSPHWRFVRNPFTRKDPAKMKEEPEQAELALDLVKPLRNELNDSDLEVLSVAKPVPAPAPVPVKVTPGETTGFLWNRLTARLFGARRT